MTIESIWHYVTNKSYRNFMKLCNRQQHELMRIVKQDCPLFDAYGYDELVYALMRGQHEYFSKGDNVWQVDESRMKIVAELAEAMTLFCEAEYIYHEAEFEEDFKTYRNWRFKNKPDVIVSYESINEDAMSAKNAFASYFIEHYGNWWD